LADLKPSTLAISARVGGAPVLAMVFWISSKISCWRAVSLGLSVKAVSWWGLGLLFHPVTVFLNSFLGCASLP
jgi:hypothetical protein